MSEEVAKENIIPIIKNIETLFAIEKKYHSKVYLEKYGESYKECRLSSDQNGFGQLAHFFLKCAIAPTNKELKLKRLPTDSSLDLFLSDLLKKDSNIDFNWIERNNHLAQYDHVTPTSSEKATALFTGFLILLILTLAAIGVYSLYHWL